MPAGASTVSGSVSGPTLRQILVVVSVCICPFVASSCATGINAGHFQSVDPMFTGSVNSGDKQASDREESSDETTIRNAVSSANLEELGDASIAWANLDTGSRGAVTAISEIREGALLCRKFTASRESFEGVSLYRGTACLIEDGNWIMREFAPV